MVMYGELFVYGKVNLTARQKRLVEVREAAARRERERARRWAAKARAKVAAEKQPLALQDSGGSVPPVEVCTACQGKDLVRREVVKTQDVFILQEAQFLRQEEDGGPLLLQQGQEEALARHSGSVLEVPVTLHWPLLPVTDVALRLMPRTRGGSVTVRGVLVPYPQGARPVWRLTGVDQYLERSMALIRFHDFATRRREAAARRGAIGLAELRALDEHLRQRDARRGAADARWLALGVVRGALCVAPFLCSAAFPAGRDVQDWVADCSALLPRPSPSDD